MEKTSQKKTQGSKFSFVVSAMRPYSIWASVLPILSAISYSAFFQINRRGFFDPSVVNSDVLVLSKTKVIFFIVQCLMLVLLGIFFQISVNLFNDFFDRKNGVDEAKNKFIENNESAKKLRLTAGGNSNPNAIFIAAMIVLSLAIITGAALVLTSKLQIFEKDILIALGVLAVLASYFYSHNKFGYSSYGYEELVEFVFFALVSVLGSCLILCSRVDIFGLLIALIMGIPTSCMLIVDNIRDIESDKKAGKRTLMVKIGKVKSKNLFITLMSIVEVTLFVFCLVFCIKSSTSFFYYIPIFLLFVIGTLLTVSAVKSIKKDQYPLLFKKLFVVDLKNLIVIISVLLVELLF